MQRKIAILDAATDHFGRFGFRGASLRDIARDAGVSLTLLNHHFGSKADLLDAVVETERPMLDERAAALRRIVHTGGFTPRDLVHAWVQIAIDAVAQPDGLRFLRLVARVVDDPVEEDVPAMREHLDDARLVFIDALLQCYPNASRRGATLACLAVSGASMKVLTSGDRLWGLSGAERPGAVDGDQARLEDFLVAGIEAALGGA